MLLRKAKSTTKAVASVTPAVVPDFSPITKAKQVVLFEVLQNGSYLDATQKPYGKKTKVTLGPARATLVLPFYPMAQPLELATIDKDGVHLNLDATWEGFGTRKGQPIEFYTGHRETLTLTLKPGDFCSLAKSDLRVLVRISPEKSQKKRKLDKSYRRNFHKLYLGTRIERQILGLSVFLGLFLISMFVAGLLVRKDNRPTSKLDLDSQYNIAFIHPDHIRNLPEALQSNLDRTKPLISAMQYYEGISQRFMGLDFRPHKYIFKSTNSYYKNLYANQDKKIARIFDQQRSATQTALAKPNTAVIAVPAVVGETLAGGLIRLSQKISSIHETLHKTLEKRRETTQEFSDYVGYDFEAYQQSKTTGDAVNSIAKLSIFKLDTNEQVMYKEANTKANEAQAIQNRIHHSREEIIPLTPANSAPLGLIPGSEILTFTPESHWSQNTKIASITASTFGVEKKVIKEPLIGEINPNLIETVINRNKFELQLCFELALRRNRNLAGEMEFYWQLDSRGQISNLTLKSSTIPDRNMKRCVQKKIASWRFPKPKRGSVEITYPFVFRPAKG